jgi:hypothetical protein
VRDSLPAVGFTYYTAFFFAEQEAKSRKRKGLWNMSKKPFLSSENTNIFLQNNSLLEYNPISAGLL